MRMSDGLVQELASLAGRGVAGADRDGDVGLGETEALGRLPDAGQRAAEVALHVDGEGLERGDVQHPAALPRLRRRRLGGQPVEGPQERGQRLARAGRRHDEGVLAVPDRAPGAPSGRASARRRRPRTRPGWPPRTPPTGQRQRRSDRRSCGSAMADPSSPEPPTPAAPGSLDRLATHAPQTRWRDVHGPPVAAGFGTRS